jgi:hypothetical protein
VSNEEQGQSKEWHDAVGVFIVHEDGRELVMRGADDSVLMAPGHKPELAIAAAKQVVKEGARARVLRFSAREVLFDGTPTPEDAAKLKAELAERERKRDAALAAMFEGIAGQLRKEKPEAK